MKFLIFKFGEYFYGVSLERVERIGTNKEWQFIPEINLGEGEKLFKIKVKDKVLPAEKIIGVGDIKSIKDLSKFGAYKLKAGIWENKIVFIPSL